MSELFSRWWPEAWVRWVRRGGVFLMIAAPVTGALNGYSAGASIGAVFAVCQLVIGFALFRLIPDFVSRHS